jgi:ABC-type lipoprotein release transport system permease subunit
MRSLMKLPFKYVINNFRSRKTTTAITVLGIAMVVFVFAAVLMMAYGIEKTLAATGSDDNVMILRKAASGEISSIISGETGNIIQSLPNIFKDSEGKPVLSKEPVVIINLEIEGGGYSNITVRGVSAQIKELRPQVKIIKGKMFNPALRELIVGSSIARKFPQARLNQTLKFAGNNWTVVGIFSTEGTGFDSEIWGDGFQMLDAFNRGSSVSTMTVKLDDPSNFEQFKQNFDNDQRLKQFEPKREKVFFAEQSEGMSTFIRILGLFITVIFSIGATVGAMITMYTAVANRTVEIGTLRALGFRRRSILSAFLIESMIIAILGSTLGLIIASFLQFFTISTLNFQSFAELSFSFALSPSIIVSCLIFALMMGLFGGFLPSVRASRLKIVDALRAG